MSFLRFAVPGLLLALAACSGPVSRETETAPAGVVTPPADAAATQDAATRPAPAAAEAVQAQSHNAAKRHAEVRREIFAAHAPLAPPMFAPPPVAESRERYGEIRAHPVQRVAEAPVSTFSIDVDTGAYANVRRFLQQGQRPPRDAVRVEELVNYFDYGYATPPDPGTPFAVMTEIAPTPWNAKTHLLHVGIQGFAPEGPRPPANLVFLIDVSGSMADADKLPLVKAALKLLLRDLRAQDRISLVVYAGASGVALEPTPGNRRAEIETAIDQLGAGGATHGAAGIALAYQLAEKAFIRNGVNRVLLATDGDFNVGVTRFEDLLAMVEDRRRNGVALTTLGFGQHNLNEQLMEQLADRGNGNYAYIDSLSEAHKVLVRQRDATLQTIARDVKVQIEFNPRQVAEYRLIGYENRALRREDFANDAIDAGEIGAGHRVTAIYEIALTGSGGERIAPLRYGEPEARVARGDELAHLRLRYKRPGEGMAASSRLIERVLRAQDIAARGAPTSDAFRLSAAAAAFGQLLRGSEYLQGFDYTRLRALAQSARGRDEHGETGEFLRLIDLAAALDTRVPAPETADAGG